MAPSLRFENGHAKRDDILSQYDQAENKFYELKSAMKKNSEFFENLTEGGWAIRRPLNNKISFLL